MRRAVESTRDSDEERLEGRIDALTVIPLVAACAVVGVGGAALLLAIAGWYRAWLALALGVPLAALLAAVPLRDGIRPLPPGPARVAAVLAVLLAAGFSCYAAIAPSEHVYFDRDPASYVATALWIDRHGSLEVAPEQHEPFVDASGLTFVTPAVYDTGGGRLNFQFNHLTAALLAVASDLGGTWAMFRVPALLSGLVLLAVYGVAVRCTGRPFAALVAPGLLATAMPFFATARDVYSEPLAALLIWTGVAVLTNATRHIRAGPVVVGAVLLAGATMARIDTSIYAAAAAVVLVTATACWPERFTGVARRTANRAILAGSVPVVIGFCDLLLRSRSYVDQQSVEVAVMAAAFLSSAVLAVVVRANSARVRAALESATRRAALARGTAICVVAVAVGLWFIRPLLQRARAPHDLYLVASLQQRDGLAIDGARLYSEHSVEWLSWYLGVAGLALAIAGLAVATHRLLRGKGNPALFATAALLGISAAVTLVAPRINPDHIWAMRRFVPVLIPALCLMATVPVAAVRRGRPAATLAVAALAGLVVAGALVPTWAVRRQREQYGFAAAVEAACTLVGDRAVVVVGPESSIRTPQTLRSWCDVPVASALPELTAGDVRALARRWADAGRELVLVTTEADSLTPYLPITTAVARTGVAVNDKQLEKTLTRAPSDYVTESLEFVVAGVDAGVD